MRDKFRISLALNIALQTAFVTASAMAVYALFQYLTMPEYTVFGLFLEHSWHVLVLGVLTYAVLYFVLHRQIIKPINDIYVKCYAITKGDHSKIETNSKIIEIQTIVDGINMMQNQVIAMTDDDVYWIKDAVELLQVISRGDLLPEDSQLLDR